MAETQKFLAKCNSLCASLKEKGMDFELAQGMIAARGFADLGFEEFSLLTSNKISSIYTGKVSELPEEEKKHFFCVPSEKMLTDKILKCGIKIDALVFENQREWKLLISDGNSKEVKSFIAEDVRLALIECLLNV